MRTELPDPTLATQSTMHEVLRRNRHRSVERHLDAGSLEVAKEASDGSYERFSAAVFHHKASKLAPKASANLTKTAAAQKSRMVANAGSEYAPTASTVTTADPHEMDTSSAIYSLRPGSTEASFVISMPMLRYSANMRRVIWKLMLY